jgi:integrase/recombinase XerD
MKLSDGIERFVSSKREAGVAYIQPAFMLLRFNRQVGDVQLSEITTQNVATFLDVSSVRPYTWHAKYNLLRRLFEHWTWLGSMPPLLMPFKRVPVRSRFLPYVYNTSEIRCLLEGTSKNQINGACALGSEPFRLILFILFTTGATLGEVVQLKRRDIDLKRRMMTVCTVRTRRLRDVPVSAEVCKILRGYLKWRFDSREPDAYLFLKKSGQVVDPVSFRNYFRTLVRRCGVRRLDGMVGWPRISDFRPTFAAHRITEWLRDGANLNRMLPALAAYLGQLGMNSVDRYLRLTPERFRKQLIALSPRRGRSHWRDDETLMRFLAAL